MDNQRYFYCSKLAWFSIITSTKPFTPFDRKNHYARKCFTARFSGYWKQEYQWVGIGISQEPHHFTWKWNLSKGWVTRDHPNHRHPQFAHRSFSGKAGSNEQCLTDQPFFIRIMLQTHRFALCGFQDQSAQITNLPREVFGVLKYPLLTHDLKPVAHRLFHLLQSVM